MKISNNSINHILMFIMLWYNYVKSPAYSTNFWKIIFSNMIFQTLFISTFDLYYKPWCTTYTMSYDIAMKIIFFKQVKLFNRNERYCSTLFVTAASYVLTKFDRIIYADSYISIQNIFLNFKQKSVKTVSIYDQCKRC